MRHTCPDSKQTKLQRSGPVGTMVGVTYSCPNCGWAKGAATIEAEAKAILFDPAIRAALR
jgi:hypothetical protein